MHEGEFRLTPSERRELRDRLRSRTLPAEDVRRARLIMLLARGKSYLAIRQVLGCNPNYISRWKGRFEAERLAGLYSHHPGRAVEKRTPALEARILEWTRRPAPDGSTHWSSRKLAQHLGISHMMVARVWRRAGVKPHRIERYMASDDPDFETKAADIIGLYVKPPQRRCFAWTKRLPSRLWIGSIRCCHCRRGGWSATALSTTATAPFRCTPRLTPKAAKWWAKPPRATPVRNLSPSSRNWSLISHVARRFI
jgi:transposase